MGRFRHLAMGEWVLGEAGGIVTCYWGVGEILRGFPCDVDRIVMSSAVIVWSVDRYVNNIDSPYSKLIIQL